MQNNLEKRLVALLLTFSLIGSATTLNDFLLPDFITMKDLEAKKNISNNQNEKVNTKLLGKPKRVYRRYNLKKNYK